MTLHGGRFCIPPPVKPSLALWLSTLSHHCSCCATPTDLPILGVMPTNTSERGFCLNEPEKRPRGKTLFLRFALKHMQAV